MNKVRSHLLPTRSVLSRVPYWLMLTLLGGVFFLWYALNDQDYSVILSAISRGMFTTLYVSFIAYVSATLTGLIFGLMRVSSVRIIREAASLYIEIVRGIPMLVILYYIAFVGAPALVEMINFIASPLIEIEWLEKISVRDLNFVWRAILALTVGYSAFIAEVFRAGIESVDPGQTEAARALGMSGVQTMRFVVLPQAVRNVLPPLANEFVAMVKDSALVSVLGVQDITQLGKVYSASTFLFFETYNAVAFLYLVLTISLSMAVRSLEGYLQRVR